MTILIVDDSKMNIKVAEDTLREFQVGAHILTCLSAEEALSILETQAVDLILLDIVMPGLTGVDLLKILKKKALLEITKVVMLTTVDDFMVLKECFDHGATDYINKPFNKIEFTARVKSALSELDSEKKLIRALELMERQNKELIRVNQMLNEAQAFMIEKEKMTAVGELVGGLTEDIKKPLHDLELELERSIKRLDLLTPESGAEVLFHLKNNLKEGLSEAEEASKRIQKLITALSSLTRDHRLDALAPVRLSDLLEDALSLMQSDLQGLERIDKKFGDPSMLVLNKGEIKKAMIHLLKNALYAMKDQDEPVLTLRTIETDETIMCVIEDNGVGIPDGIQTHIFDPFYTTKPRNEHMGIGLTLVHDVVVNRHKGQIDIESKPGKGTRITLVFERKD